MSDRNGVDPQLLFLDLIDYIAGFKASCPTYLILYFMVTLILNAYTTKPQRSVDHAHTF